MFKSSKKKLITSGCSFTDSSYTFTHGFPVWPDVLGEMLDMEVINLGKSGKGNEYIYSTILDCLTKEKNVGLVIAMWGESSRIDFEVPHREDKKRTRPHIKEWQDIQTIRENPDFWKDIVSDCLTEYGFVEMYARTKKSMRLIYSFQEVMKSKNINYLQMVGCGLEPPMYANKVGKLVLDSIYFDLIDEKYFVGWPMIREIGGNNVSDFLTKFDKTRTKNIIDGSKVYNDNGKLVSYLKDSHPNKLGHEQVAKVLYDAYKEIYDVP
tara:strand:+ start:227 stop:1024 length:798 start_codon:yes stop_codon:yes gene_type:complete